MEFDVRLAQLISSRLCHDVVGAAGAVNAGLELLEDDPGDISGPLDLITKSSKQLSRRLAFFRIAFGQGGGREGQAPLSEVRDLCEGFLEGGRVALSWPNEPEFGPGTVLPVVATKAFLNAVLMAVESLPRGGDIRVRFVRAGGHIGFAVEGIGDGARIPEDLVAALGKSPDPAALSARNAHGFLVNGLVKGVSGSLDFGVDEYGRVQFAVLVPDAA